MADDQQPINDWITPPTDHPAEAPNDWVKPPASEAPRGTLADTAHGLGKGLVEGAGYVLGMPADVWHMIDKGYQWALTKGAESMGMLTPEQGAALRQPMVAAGEGEEPSLGSGNINRHLLRGAAALGADVSPPTSTPGQYAETIGSFLPGAGAMGARSVSEVPAALAKYGVLPGLTSETAGQMTSGTPVEPYARAAGALVPGAAAYGWERAVSASNPLHAAISGLSDAQAASAQQLLQESRAAGAPLTVAEAIQQVTGGSTRLGDVQRVVEQSPKGAAVMRPFMAERPAQTEAAGRAAVNQIGPAGEPYEVAPRVQAAAQGVVDQADRARSAAVKPLYQAAAADQVDPAKMSALLDRIDQDIAADKTGLLAPKLGQLRDALIEPAPPPAAASAQGAAAASPARIPITDIENLDRARKYFRDQITQPPVAMDAVPKEVAGKLGSYLDDLRGMMVDASPDFATAKQRYQELSRDVVDPLVRSPTGKLAEAEQFPQQAAVLFNSNPLPGSQKAIGQAVRSVAATDPDAAAQLVRMHIEKTFNEATQANQGGANQFGGPKFRAQVMGNPQQAANLEAAIRALPQGDLRWNAFKKTMDILEGMGQRNPPGSMTSFNQEIINQLKGGKLPGELLGIASSPGKWTDFGHKLYQNYAYGRNTDQLARIFTTGSVADLQKLATAAPRTWRGQAALLGALANIGAEQTQPQP